MAMRAKQSVHQSVDSLGSTIHPGERFDQRNGIGEADRWEADEGKEGFQEAVSPRLLRGSMRSCPHVGMIMFNFNFESRDFW